MNDIRIAAILQLWTSLTQSQAKQKKDEDEK
jgi:hypothetical protein